MQRGCLFTHHATFLPPASQAGRRGQKRGTGSDTNGRVAELATIFSSTVCTYCTVLCMGMACLSLCGPNCMTSTPPQRCDKMGFVCTVNTYLRYLPKLPVFCASLMFTLTYSFSHLSIHSLTFTLTHPHTNVLLTLIHIHSHSHSHSFTLTLTLTYPHTHTSRCLKYLIKRAEANQPTPLRPTAAKSPKASPAPSAQPQGGSAAPFIARPSEFRRCDLSVLPSKVAPAIMGRACGYRPHHASGQATTQRMKEVHRKYVQYSTVGTVLYCRYSAGIRNISFLEGRALKVEG